MNQNLEMQVCSGRASSSPNLGDFLDALDQITLLDQHHRGMRIARDKVVSMVDLQHVAVFGIVLLGHHATGGGEYRRAGVGLKVKPRMQR